MKRFFLSMIILLCLNSGNVLSKTVTLKYKAGYSVTCSIENKEVVNASDFLLLDIHGNEIVKGTVKSISPQLLIAGNYHFTEGTVDVLSFGDFSISNTAGDGFTINERKGSTPVISPISIRSAYFSGEKREISFTDSDATSMLLTIDWLASSKDTESAIKKLSVRVANNLISAYGYTAIDNLLQNTPSGYTIEWTNGISFNGNISHYIDSDGSLSLEEGTLSSTSCTETIKRGTEKDTFVYSREETNTSSAAINKMVITVPERVVKAYNYWNVPQIINRGLTGTFFLNGGDSFDGEYSAPIENGQITKISFNKGTYRWGAGDVFVGNYSGKSFGGIPIDGVLTLAAGETLRGQWWKDMQFSEKEWNEFLAYQSPSEKLSFYKRVSSENIVKKAIDSIRTLLSKGDVPQAITIVNEYGELAHSSSQKEAWQEVLLLLNDAEESTPLENIGDSETAAVQPKPNNSTSHHGSDSTTAKTPFYWVVLSVVIGGIFYLITRCITHLVNSAKIRRFRRQYDEAPNPEEKTAVGKQLALYLAKELKRRRAFIDLFYKKQMPPETQLNRLIAIGDEIQKLTHPDGEKPQEKESQNKESKTHEEDSAPEQSNNDTYDKRVHTSETKNEKTTDANDPDPDTSERPSRSFNKRNETPRNPFQELNDLIGIASVKKEIRGLIDYIKIQQLRQRQGMKSAPLSLHCVFTGNPGTGKTTVARIVAAIYKDLGLLKKGHLVETDRSGLVAEYLGQTATKTNHIIDSALDGVLFIDEAYTLSDGGDNDPYGKEAIATLLKRMEDERDRLVVIIAGYTNEMKRFINSNPGLQSRFTRYIEFPDYSVEELCQIFSVFADKYEYRLSNDAQNKLRSILYDAILSKDSRFGNGRFARNLFEKAIQNQANRLSIASVVNSDDMAMLLPIDFATSNLENAKTTVFKHSNQSGYVDSIDMLINLSRIVKSYYNEHNS